MQQMPELDEQIHRTGLELDTVAQQVETSAAQLDYVPTDPPLSFDFPDLPSRAPAEIDILQTYFQMAEGRRQRLRFLRLLHPEVMKWKKRAHAPTASATARIRITALENLGLGEAHFQFMQETEIKSKGHLEELAQNHPLWEHFQRFDKFGPYLCGCFIAAGGNIFIPCKVSSFWKGMGLDVLPDGTVPRRVRGARDNPRPVPCLPFVSTAGEQIRQQMLRAKGALYAEYLRQRELEDSRFPDKPKMFRFKGALRRTQKLLYACLWYEWRTAYGLPAPEPYAIDHLGHTTLINVSRFYDK